MLSSCVPWEREKKPLALQPDCKTGSAFLVWMMRPAHSQNGLRLHRIKEQTQEIKHPWVRGQRTWGLWQIWLRGSLRTEKLNSQKLSALWLTYDPKEIFTHKPMQKFTHTYNSCQCLEALPWKLLKQKTFTNFVLSLLKFFNRVYKKDHLWKFNSD